MTENILLLITLTLPTLYLVLFNQRLKNTQEQRIIRSNSVLLLKLILGIQKLFYQLHLASHLSSLSSPIPPRVRREASLNLMLNVKYTLLICQCIRMTSPSQRTLKKEWRMLLVMKIGRSLWTLLELTMLIRWFLEEGMFFSINIQRNLCLISQAWILMWRLQLKFSLPTCSVLTWVRTWKGIRIKPT